MTRVQVIVESEGVVCRLEDTPIPEHEARIDDFLVASPATSFMQRVPWSRLVPLSRLQRFRYLWCEHSGRLLLAGVVRFTVLCPGRYLAWFPRGPVVREIPDLQRCLSQVKEVLRRAGVCTVLMNPRWEDGNAEEVCRVLVGHGFREVPRANQSMYEITGNIDLTPSEDEIFAGFETRCRNDIRRAARKGLIVRPAETEADAIRFRTLFAEFGAKKARDIYAHPDPVDQWRFVQAEGGAFLLTEINGELIGGLVAFREGSRAVLYILPSRPISTTVPRSHPPLWEAMRIMKGKGCREFDLGGLPHEDIVDESKQKIKFFKRAFQPRVVRLVPIHVAALHPVSHAALFWARQAYRRSSLRRRIGPMLWRRGVDGAAE